MLDESAGAKLSDHLLTLGISSFVRQSGATLAVKTHDPARQAEADLIAATWPTELPEPPEPRPDDEVVADIAAEIKGAPEKTLARLLLLLEKREPGVIARLGLKTKKEKT